ncbi:MAG: glycosyltransferase [Pontixanthobacter sp.]
MRTDTDTQAVSTNDAKTTIVVTPRERFGLAVRSLNSIVDLTKGAYDLVYVDGNAPASIARQLREICAAAGFRYVRRNHFLSPNQARNIGLAQANTRYIAFIDNDVIVTPSWLVELQRCADETGAEVVTPITCQSEPLHSQIHQAGGEITADLGKFFSGPASERRLIDRHIQQGKPIEVATDTRTDVQACEFHCVLARRDLFDAIGPFDEKLLATKEHIDFSLTVWATGGRVVLEPKSIVTYLFPAGANRLQPADWPYFALRWSPAWLKASLQHFQHKWDCPEDPYFERRIATLGWRHREGIVRPTIKRFPWLARRGRLGRAVANMGNKAVDVWSARMADRQARQSAEQSGHVQPQRTISSDREFPVHS